MNQILAMVLAGGRGMRLGPLTQDRAKPAVPFGGEFRIIDFVINNLINSGIFKIKILTQFKADSLICHLHDTWNMSRMLGHYVDCVPAQMRTGQTWFTGTADAVYQNMYHIERERPPLVAVFGGDHVYKMDLKQLVDFHFARDSEITLCALPRPLYEATQFGVLEVDAHDRIAGFEEKPAGPKPMPGNPDQAFVSMGNYLFDTQVLLDLLSEDSQDRSSSHDFGKDILPRAIRSHRVCAYDFTRNVVPGMTPRERGYWRDVGTVDCYMEANMDLRSVEPVFNLYNRQWPMRTATKSRPPAKFVFAQEGGRRGVALDSLVSGGAIISGSLVQNCIICPDAFIHSYSKIFDSIIMHGVDIGRGCNIRRAIIDKGVHVPPGTTIGADAAEDKQRFYVSPSGVVVIGKDYVW